MKCQKLLSGENEKNISWICPEMVTFKQIEQNNQGLMKLRINKHGLCVDTTLHIHGKEQTGRRDIENRCYTTV